MWRAGDVRLAAANSVEKVCSPALQNFLRVVGAVFREGRGGPHDARRSQSKTPVVDLRRQTDETEDRIVIQPNFLQRSTSDFFNRSGMTFSLCTRTLSNINAICQILRCRQMRDDAAGATDRATRRRAFAADRAARPAAPASQGRSLVRSRALGCRAARRGRRAPATRWMRWTCSARCPRAPGARCTGVVSPLHARPAS